MERDIACEEHWVVMTITDQNAAIAELSPTGLLRAGVVEAPHAGVFFVARNEATPESPRGVTVDLIDALAHFAGLPVQYIILQNSGECTDALAAGQLDISFMPVDDERRRRVAFGSAYYLVQSTYMVSADSGIDSLEEVDQPHIRVVGIANTTTIRAATRTLSRTTPRAAASVKEAIALFREGSADAIALSQDSLAPLLSSIPGSKILKGAFQQTSISIALPKHRPAALHYASAFIEHAKESGVIRRIFDNAGLQAESVAPAGQ
jgi:polar amino acid transport system substrate-binding protein